MRDNPTLSKATVIGLQTWKLFGFMLIFELYNMASSIAIKEVKSVY